ncbi:Clp amino terminal domain-containing protein, pathogenicity island component [Duganella sp. OV458]|nr:Clp amino terminal domain-containing protein, pathogenicity island component [Duganella sp. OV458]SDK07721.1 Clp amino terminal domain-containing protein, pathogenicity island component [Duganella sp. OV510]
MFAKLKQRWKDTRTIMALSLDAERRALQEGQRHPGAEHYMLAALDLPDGSARRVFERLGADPDAYRAALANRHTAALNAMGLHVDAAAPSGAAAADQASASATASGRRSLDGAEVGDASAAASGHTSLNGAQAGDASVTAAIAPCTPSVLFDAQPSGQSLMQSLPELQRRLPAPLCGAHVLLAAATMAHSAAGRAFNTIDIDLQALGNAAEAELQATMAS